MLASLKALYFKGWQAIEQIKIKLQAKNNIFLIFFLLFPLNKKTLKKVEKKSCNTKKNTHYVIYSNLNYNYQTKGKL